MNKKTIALWLAYGAVLVFLYILSSTDLIIKENEAKVYPVSVILDGISGENLENMKKGMDEAAYEHSIDMSFPAIAENITFEEKLEIVEDAIEAGAKAIIVGNRWKQDVAAEIKKNHPEVPVLVVGDIPEEKEESTVSVNYFNIVKILSENIRAAESINNEICLVAEDFRDEDTERIKDGICEKLGAMGYKINFTEGEGPALEKQLKEFDNKNAIFVSLDKESSVRMVKYASDNNFKAKIYAVGYTDYLLGKLEDGEVKGIVAWNEYDMGYFIIEKLMKMSDDKTVEKNEIETFYITEKELKNEDYIKKLYPING